MLSGVDNTIDIEGMFSVSIQPLAQFARHPSWTREFLHSSERHRLIWITRGQSSATFAGKNHQYGPNSVMVIPAGTMHSIDVKQTVFGTIMEINPFDFLSMPTEPVHLRIRDALAQGRFVALVENLQREISNPDSGHRRACLFHAGIIGVWLERTIMAGQHGDIRPAATQRLVTNYMQLVEDLFSTGKNVTDIAARMNVTPTHLTRCCKKVLGKSSLTILNERIHYEARICLANTKAPVQDIAQTLGFTSAAYFTRAFQAIAHTTPSQFRAAHSKSL